MTPRLAGKFPGNPIAVLLLEDLALPAIRNSQLRLGQIANEETITRWYRQYFGIKQSDLPIMSTNSGSGRQIKAAF